jgi:hypothetical protein
MILGDRLPNPRSLAIRLRIPRQPKRTENQFAVTVLRKQIDRLVPQLRNEPNGKMGGFQSHPTDGAAIAKRTQWQAGQFSERAQMLVLLEYAGLPPFAGGTWSGRKHPHFKDGVKAEGPPEQNPLAHPSGESLRDGKQETKADTANPYNHLLAARTV